MISASIRNEIETAILDAMHGRGWNYVKSLKAFRKDQEEWTCDCVLNFTNRKSHLALRTGYYITNKKIILDWKSVAGHVACTPYIFGGDDMAVAKHMGLNCSRKSIEQIFLEHESIDKFHLQWIRDLEEIGIPFWEKYCSIDLISHVVNGPPFDNMPPLALSGVNRVLRGPLLAYYAKIGKKDMLELLSRYEKISKTIMAKDMDRDFSGIKNFILEKMKDPA